MTYEYYQNNLCVMQDVFVELQLLTTGQFQKWCQRQKLNRLRTAGNGRTGLIEWTSIPEQFRKAIKKAFGDPYAKDDVNSFIGKLENDQKAAAIFQRAQISEEREYQYYIEAQILNRYGKLYEQIKTKSARNKSFKKTEAKKRIAKVIAELKTVTYPNSDKKRFPHSLPANWRSLERKYKKYAKEGPKSLIHGGAKNKSATKIKGQVADWLLANYCLPNKPNTTVLHRDYSKKRQAKNWPELTESAIYQWLQQPKQRKVWVLARHGKATWIEEFGHKVTRDRSDWFPYAYLAIDGTKLDWMHYKEGAGYNMGADIYINLVFDMHSERIIGWDFLPGKVEDHKSHFRSFKMAIQEAGCKPALITYDNQSGHKMETMQNLYDRLVTSNGGEHYPHRAKEHGSPVEQLIGRFQKQVLNQKWFSDKQGIRTRTADSRPNTDFIIQNRHKLKRPEELEKVFKQCVAEWNEMKHPHFDESRNQVSLHKPEYPLEEVSTLEMMQLFWVTAKKPATYKRDGLRLKIGKEKHHFEVYDNDNRVDADFRDNYTGCKFFVQYDSDELDNYVRLHLKLPNGDTKYIADAQPVKKIKNINALMSEKDEARKHKMLQTRDQDLQNIEQELEALRHRTNITPEKLIEDHESRAKFAGNLPKEEREAVESTAGSWTDKL